MSGLFLSVPMPNFGQTKDTTSTPATDPAKAAAQPGVKKPLSPMEDPSQIGKRKVNGGSDKFFGWLGGSQEKEIAIGRQLLPKSNRARRWLTTR
jgi:hypothetical protein